MELHIPTSNSLKAKRAVVRHIVETARRRYGVAASEVDHHDVWQRAGLGFSAVAPDAVTHRRRSRCRGAFRVVASGGDRGLELPPLAGRGRCDRTAADPGTGRRRPGGGRGAAGGLPGSDAMGCAVTSGAGSSPTSSACVTLLAIAVPEQLATSRLAGMPPVTGLYTFIAGSLVFGDCWGRTPCCRWAPIRPIAPLFAAGVGHLAPTGSADYVALVSLVAVTVGVLVALVGLSADGMDRQLPIRRRSSPGSSAAWRSSSWCTSFPTSWGRRRCRAPPCTASPTRSGTSARRTWRRS